jgi:hypothetical protein
VPHGAGIFSQAGLTAGGNKQLGLEERGKGRLNLDAGFVCVEKRWRATAVQDAGALPMPTEPRKAFWSAPALWRFGGRRNSTQSRKDAKAQGKPKTLCAFCAFCAFLRLKLAVLLV